MPISAKTLDVRWDRDGGVEVGITVRHVNGPDCGQIDEDRSACAHFDRAAVNKLIRDLRRARNTAFGVDE